MTSFFMCRPDQFYVSYSINPHMKPHNWKEEFKSKSWKQWYNLKDKLISLGAEIYLMVQPEGVPDMVFIANAGVVFNKKIIMSNFRYDERKSEEKINTEKALRLIKKKVLKELIKLPPDIKFEGQGDYIYDQHRNMYWGGYGFRSNLEASRFVFQTFGVTVHPLELIDPKYYHLDIALSVLSKGHIIYYPEAFSVDSQAKLLNNIAKNMRIEASIEDMENFSLNMISFNEHIITNYCRPELVKRLEEKGYIIHQIPLDSFMLAGGAAACLVLRLDHGYATAIKSVEELQIKSEELVISINPF